MKKTLQFSVLSPARLSLLTFSSTVSLTRVFSMSTATLIPPPPTAISIPSRWNPVWPPAPAGASKVLKTSATA